MRTHQSEVGKLEEVYINPVQNAFGDLVMAPKTNQNHNSPAP